LLEEGADPVWERNPQDRVEKLDLLIGQQARRALLILLIAVMAAACGNDRPERCAACFDQARNDVIRIATGDRLQHRKSRDNGRHDINRKTAHNDPMPVNLDDVDRSRWRNVQ
jgi:hypothetical protein